MKVAALAVAPSSRAKASTPKLCSAGVSWASAVSGRDGKLSRIGDQQIERQRARARVTPRLRPNAAEIAGDNFSSAATRSLPE